MDDVTTDMRPGLGIGLTRNRTLGLLALGLLVAAFWAGTLNPRSVVTTAFCDTTGDSIRCLPDGEVVPVVVHEDGLWQDAQHVWRRGRPDCLRESGREVGPVQVAVVEGGDDGMSWQQVVWVGCP